MTIGDVQEEAERVLESLAVVDPRLGAVLSALRLIGRFAERSRKLTPSQERRIRADRRIADARLDALAPNDPNG